MLTKAPKGTKDMLPDDAYKWHYIEDVFAEICMRYGFREMRTPVFEHTELFQRGVGDTTDIVQKEMYTWEQAGRSLTLRPEGTAPVVRSFVENKIYACPQPTKLYYDISCFRYEKPQSGRLRQFHQFGVETFGTRSMLADTSVIALAYDFLTLLGIKNFRLEINSIGCPVCRQEHREALKTFLEPKFDDLCSTCKTRYDKNPLRIMDCKNPVCHKLTHGAPRMIDYLCDECTEAFEDLQENLKAMDIPFTVNPGIVRGLDYYTKTAFEFVTDTIGAQGTICGGGRYDNLSESIGGPPIPGVGFGLGKERLLLVMEAEGIEIPNTESVDVLVAFMGDEAKHEALGLAHRLRGKGVKVEMDSMERNIKGQFKYADRVHADYTLILGESELERGVVSIKNMKDGEQREIPYDFDLIVEKIKND